jgi:intein/homing endonuclease
MSLKKTKYARMNESERQKAIDLYLSGYKKVDIAKKIGFTRPAISYMLRREGITCTNGRTNPMTNYHFDKMNNDNEDFWYLLGLFSADGSATEREVKISSKDYDLLKMIENIFCKKESIFLCNMVNGKKYYVVSFFSSDISDRFREFLKFNKKTFDLEYPEFKNKEKEFAYIRGFIDGDGCIYKDKSLSFCSASEKFINKITSRLKHLGYNSGLYKSSSSDSCKVVNISGGKSSRGKFLRNMYRNSEHLRLNRKFVTYTNYYL